MNYELRSIKSNNSRKESGGDHQPGKCTYYEIQPGDSLQSICLRFSREVNQVRRLNGLMTDQDFYGLKRLKLPLGKFGLLQDFLEEQQDTEPEDGQPLLFDHNNALNQSKMKSSPGSALSMTARRDYPQFRPLLSLDHSSYGIDDQEHQHGLLNTPKHSQENRTHLNHNFIKSDTVPDLSQVTIDNMLSNEDPTVNKIFEELDYHVEKVKEATSSYEKRADEILYAIDSNSDGPGMPRMGTRTSKIPELFCSGENFGLNIKRLVALIIFVCLVIPLVYTRPRIF